MRHRVGLAELSLLTAAISSAGVMAVFFDINGNLSPDKQIELSELVGLGILVVASFTFFAWRRFAELEREIQKRIGAEERARFLAHHDHLTGLPNRRELQRALNAAVAIPPSAEQSHAVFVLDLNDFKKVNDLFGHARGDEILSVAAARMTKIVGHSDLLARTGGDEFAIVARDVCGLEGAAGIAEQIIKSIEEPIVIGGDQHRIGTAIGITLMPWDGVAPDEVLRRADVALYKAKAGGGAFAFFQDGMDQEARDRDILQHDFADAIAAGAIVPHYQPVVDLRTEKITAFEALARWTHPKLGELAPARFVPLAENIGLIRDLSDRLFRQACVDATLWPEHVGLSFNVSPSLLHDGSFGLRVLAAIAAAGLTPKRVELEITENAIVRDLEAARVTLGALRDAGVRIALDDFGTGSTSFFHLRSFKFDVVKIDRSFVEMMSSENESAQIVKAILGLGKGLNVGIVAEGVETPIQRSFLLKEGCVLGQGYLFGRAVPASETLALFERTSRGQIAALA